MNYETLASEEAITRTSEALKARKISVETAADRAAALAKIKEMIPAGADVMTGGSVTLEEIGLTELLMSGSSGWVNWKDKIMAEKDPAKQTALRKEAGNASYYLASAHALSEDGVIVQGSATGSQVGAFAFGSAHAILVVGAQKIVPTEADAIKRVKEYSLPMEDKHQKGMGNPGSALNKLLITYGEFFPGRLTVIIVKEKLGF